MTLEAIAGILFLLLWAAYASYLVFPRYAYTVAQDAVQIRRWILGVIPFGSHTILLRNVRDVVRFRPPWWPLSLLLVCGRRYSGDGVLLVLRRRHWGVFRVVYLAPDNPGRFMGEVLSAVNAASNSPAA
jgi:hypothetical protein